MIKLQSEQTWLAPDYYDNFHCKGGACRNSCCGGWGIAVSRDEYFRLIGLDCSDELHHRLECAFHLADNPSPERYALVSPNWLGDCPMHDEDGLCRLHRECGEGQLPSICRLYPRRLSDESGCRKCVCSASCEGVVELLMAEREPLSFHEEKLMQEASLEMTVNPHLAEAGRACLRLLQNRSRVLPARLRGIRRLLEIFEQTGAFDPDAAERAVSDAALPPDDKALFAVVRMLRRLSENSPSLERFGAEAFERYGAADGESLARYMADRRHFESAFPDWARIFENVLANHVFYEDFPFADDRLTVTGEYVGLAGVYAALRVLCVGYMAGRSGLDELTDVIAGLFRCVEHAAFYLNADYLLEQEAQKHTGLLDDVLNL